jgi:hypothetical protein
MRPLEEIIVEIQDFLAPTLDPFEQMLYHYLFRHTYFSGNRKIVVPARSIGPKLGKGRKDASELARNNVPRKLRSLEEKRVIKIVRKTHEGTEVEVFLPHEIPGLIVVHTHEQEVDVESIDFFSTPENRARIIGRDEDKCRYCLRPIDSQNASIDHISPQTDGVSHSFRNLVAACFECNSRKHAQNADEFLRQNYRRGLLSDGELEDCIIYIKMVKAGKIVPN